jgi:molecular chaperone HtpG
MNHNESHQFKAEIRQLLDILIHSLYQERDIFLRELISNASDALTRVHFEMLTNDAVFEPERELAIHLETKGDDDKTLVVKDSGIGMTRDELVRNLGTIAQSGASEFLKAVGSSDIAPSDIIGQFGVGFYSVFMVADEVKVISRSFQADAEAYAWISQGSDEFWVESSDKSDRGTEIHISLKKDAHEFADAWRLKQLVRKYSDYIGYPIIIDDEQANQQESIWRRNPSDVTAEEYNKYYQQLTMDFEDPLLTIHLTSDAPMHLRSLLFIPAKSERSVLNLRKDPGLALYSHNVMIQEYNSQILPKWLEFVTGVVDSEDLPLNVSRESIQSTRMMTRLGNTLRKRILRELREMSQNDQDKYWLFWEQYGRILKEGVAIEPNAKDELTPYFRFYSAKSTDSLISFEDYASNMDEAQSEIYYIIGDDLESVQLSPHLDSFKSREWDVLFFIDPIDPFLSQYLSDFNEIPLRNVDDVSLELPDIDDSASKVDEDGQPDEPDFNRLVGRMVTVLGDRVLEVNESRVLRGNPVRLVSPADSPTRDLQRIQRFITEDYEIPKKILEINRGHPLISDLSNLVRERPDDEIINLAIIQLYENALIIEGLHPNPANMMPQVERLIELAAARSLDDEEEVD